MENNLVVAEINNYPEAKYNRLFPCTLTELSPLHKVMVNQVKIDPTPNRGDVYSQNSGLALTKIACLKLMTAANVVMEESKQIFPRACQRCMQVAQATKQAPQCGTCPSKDDVAYQVSILVPEPSGGHRRYVATKEVSKERFVHNNGGKDGKPEKVPVEHMPAQCETKALLRALRAGLGIKGVYSATELQKPFAVAVVVLNAHDPELKKALIESYVNSRNALFSAKTAPQLSAPDLHALPPADDDELPNDGNTVVLTDDDDDDIPPELGTDETPPWEQEQEEQGVESNLFDHAIVCQACAQVIEKSGSWEPETIKEYSQKNFGGAIYCPACQRKIKASQKKGA
ncbi:MAG TPA: hypothetical protein DCZ10_15965 [Pelotomaculum sp.]|nr:hypothetical protein [Pelotomaculum sp.]